MMRFGKIFAALWLTLCVLLFGGWSFGADAETTVQMSKAGGEIHLETKEYTFNYSYPAVAGAIPALKTWLDKDAAQRKAEVVEWAQDTSGRYQYDSGVQWRVVTDLPAWLSLSGWWSTYTGGAHPNHGPIALLWDKMRNRKVKAADLFISPATLSAAIRQPFCAELNRQRAEKRGGEIGSINTSIFTNFVECLDPVDYTLILNSSDKSRFTHIGILIAPYDAGPYVEGDYEVTLPVTPAVLDAVRPEYRDSFALDRLLPAND